DGIRDGHVTGVQTCALPIWPSCTFASVTLTSISGNSFSDGRASLRNRVALPVFASMGQGSYGEDGVDQRATKRFPSSENSERKRSEERRVGKECRERWARKD